MYTVADYGRMIADRVRMDAYVEAMRRAIRPGDVVVDLGAGTGIMTLWACKLGARRVHAIETSPALAVARRVCRDNGVEDRVVFHDVSSTDVTLAEPADVVVADLRGTLPLFGDHLEVVADARARFLGESGRLIPQRDALFVAPIASRALHETIVAPWESAEFDLSAGRANVLESLHTHRIEVDSEDLVAEPAPWCTVAYGEAPPPLFTGRARFEARRQAAVNGLALWFDAELAPGVGFAGGPGKKLVYGISVVALPEAVPVAEGDGIEVELFARRDADDHVWGWTTTFRTGAGERAAGGGAATKTFRQSTLGGALTPPRRPMK